MRFKTHLIVYLDRLGHNLEQLKKIAPKNEILFMVKADAYGHGMAPVVRYAIQELGLHEFGCASIGEAILLREELKEFQFDLYVFSDLCLDLPQCQEAYVEKRIMPVIASLADLKYLLAHPRLKNLPLCLKFNTGMNRLGFFEPEVDEVIELLKKFGRQSVHHVFSHFSSSSNDIKTDNVSSAQYEKFIKIKKEMTQASIVVERSSMANSGAIEQGLALKNETHIRPGLMLYGVTSLTQPTALKNISQLEAHIMHLFPVKKGMPISYGAHPCPRDGLMALLSIGYGDGFTLNYLGVKIEWKGFVGEIVGRVTMDMTYLLFPPEAEGKIKEGDVVTIWNEQGSTLSRMAIEAKTIPYELLVTISSRLPRHYRL